MLVPYACLESSYLLGVESGGSLAVLLTLYASCSDQGYLAAAVQMRLSGGVCLY